MTREKASAWQKNPDVIDKNLEKLQLWSSSGIMLTAMLKYDEAVTMVKDGRCYVISNQAIGFYES